MKITKMKFLALIATFGVTGLLLSSCKDKCAPVKEVNYNINAEDLAKVPYTGLDTLYFSHNGIDTFTFVGTGKKKYSAVKNGTFGSCPPDHLNLEGYQIDFINNAQYKITIAQYILENQIGSSAIDIRFLKKGFSQPSVSIGTAPYKFNLLTIAGKQYTNISDFSFDPTDSVYYNVTYGILKFKYSSGDNWELLQKK